jgi:DNA-binding MarR family transcriptional regulator
MTRVRVKPQTATNVRPKQAAAAPPPAPGTNETQELSLAGLERFLGYAIRRAQLAIFQDFNEQTAEFGISTVQFSVLRVIRDNAGLNQRALAAALAVETSRMVLIIDELEERGLVNRIASTVDRRSRALYLTPEGVRLLKLLEKRVIAHERAIAKRLRGGDKAELLRMLRQIARPG